MSDPAAPRRDDWRTWERHGDRLIPPPGATLDECLHAMQALSLEVAGYDPDNPPPLRRDIGRVVRRGRDPGQDDGAINGVRGEAE